MNHVSKIAGVTVILLLAGGCATSQPWNGQTFALGNSPLAESTNAGQLELIDILVGRLGVTPRQAMGGVGAIFSLAQQRMNPGDFSQLSNSVPGVEHYLSSLPQYVPTANSSLALGTVGDLMAGQSGSLGNLAALAGSFQSMGMNISMISQFVPVMLQYVQQQGGVGAMGLLEHALY